MREPIRARHVVGTGYDRADAEEDFRAVRRSEARSRWLDRLRGRCGDLLVLADVLGPAGASAHREVALCDVDLDTIVGSAGRAAPFDGRFRPRRQVHRQRWEGLDRAVRTGEGLPPIEVYRVGDRHFVLDGHHRVSVARALGLATVEAVVTTLYPARSAARPAATGAVPAGAGCAAGG